MPDAFTSIRIDAAYIATLSRRLKEVDKDIDKELRKGMRASAKIVTDDHRKRAKSGSAKGRGSRSGRRSRRQPAYSRSRARTGTAQMRKMALGVKPAATGEGGRINFTNTASKPFTLGAFFGSKNNRFPPWVGASWDLNRGTGPYLLPEAIAATRDEVGAAVIDAVDQAMSKAFPD